MEGCWGMGFEMEEGGSYFFPQMLIYIQHSRGHMLRYRHLDKPRICEYLVNISARPEAKTSRERGALPTWRCLNTQQSAAICYSVSSIGGLKRSLCSINSFSWPLIAMQPCYLYFRRTGSSCGPPARCYADIMQSEGSWETLTYSQAWNDSHPWQILTLSYFTNKQKLRNIFFCVISYQKETCWWN